MNREDVLKIFSNCYLQGEKVIVKDNFKEVINTLQIKYGYDILKEIIGVDNQDKGIELIYHLFNTSEKDDLKLSYTIFSETETVTDIFKSAIADENEIYDLFGVIFNGNDSLKRLYLPQGWKGHPLKKDYVQDDTRLAWNDNNETKA